MALADLVTVDSDTVDGIDLWTVTSALYGPAETKGTFDNEDDANALRDELIASATTTAGGILAEGSGGAVVRWVDTEERGNVGTDETDLAQLTIPESGIYTLTGGGITAFVTITGKLPAHPTAERKVRICVENTDEVKPVLAEVAADALAAVDEVWWRASIAYTVTGDAEIERFYTAQIQLAVDGIGTFTTAVSGNLPDLPVTIKATGQASSTGADDDQIVTVAMVGLLAPRDAL